MATPKKASLAGMGKTVKVPEFVVGSVKAPVVKTEDTPVAKQERQPAKVVAIPVADKVAATQRLTLDIPLTLHTFIKTACVGRRAKIKDEVLSLLMQHYQEQGYQPDDAVV